MAQVELPSGPYDIVLADPPWSYYGSPDKMAAAGKHYKLMSQEELANLPLRDIMSDSAALFLWATGPRLHYAIDLIRQWGLHYRGVAYVWVKTRRDGQIIGAQGIPPTFVKPTTEFVLAATTKPRGRPFEILDFKQQQVVLAPRGEHSAKPKEVREKIVELCGDRKRIELFARDQAPGWDVWGDEAPDVSDAITEACH